MKLIKSVFTLVGCGCFLALLSGCASVTCGTKQAVALNSKPAGAQVLVYDNHCEVVFQGVTPCIAELARRNSDYESAKYIVLLKKQGFAPVQIPLDGQVNRAYFANILCGGIGFVTDPITGGMWTLATETTELNDTTQTPLCVNTDNGLLVNLPEQASPVVATHFQAPKDLERANPVPASALAELNAQFNAGRTAP
jgi:hypothetical protein